MNSLQYTLTEEHVDYSKCCEICHSALNIRASRKNKYICRNNKSFVTKPYSRAFIKGTRFRNKFLQNATEENKLINKETAVSSERGKKEYFTKMNENDTTDNRKFRQTGV